jgi:hypothetical protein
MSKKRSRQSKNSTARSEILNTRQSLTDSMSDIPDFTPEQWEWLKEQSHRFEKDYVPNRSLIPGL